MPPGDADKRVGSDKNSELVNTSLHFSSQSASSSPGNYGSQSDEPPDSPIKTSPVSERIKALEALVAKKKEPDFRSDGYSHYRDRHSDKRSSIEIQKATFEKNEKTITAQKKGSSSDKESPESPFEILGDCKPLKELEDTEEWMKAHSPPGPEFQSTDHIPKEVPEKVFPKQEKEYSAPEAPASFALVPDAFMDSPVKSESHEDSTVPQNPYSEEECDFDLSFLPTAYMCNQQEKSYDSVVPVSPPAGFKSKSSPVSSPEHKSTGDLDPPEAAEMDSSGESDDTVIEDGVPVHASSTFQSPELEKKVDSTSTPSSIPKEEKEAPPAKSERKLMQVPTINVIETDEPNYSEEEMELEVEEDEEVEEKISMDQDVKMSDSTVPERCVEKTDEKDPLENQFVEGYSPQTSPVESDSEFSPKHKAQDVSHEAVIKVPIEPQPVKNFTVQDNLPDKEPVDDFSDHDDDWGDQTLNIEKKTPDSVSFTEHKMDEKACTEVTQASLEPHNPKASFIRDESYDRESFDYDYDAPPSPTEGEDSEPDLGIDQPYTNPFLVNTEQNTLNSTVKNDNDAIQDPLSKQYPQDPYSIFYTAPVNDSEPDVDNRTQNMNLDDNCNTIKGHETETPHAESDDLISETKGGQDDLDCVSNLESTDSFVEFMRECLKSRQDEETHHTEDCVISNIMQDVHSSPTVITDLEQENLTIRALKELGSSQDEEMELPLLSAKPYQMEPSVAPAQPTTQSPCTLSVQPTSSQSNPAPDSTYAREVEAIDEWVAEAYHLAEHVLTAVLTHLSGNLFFPSLLAIDIPDL